MDSFAEQLVQKQQGAAAKTRRMLIILAGILLTLATAALALGIGGLFTFLGLMIAVGFGYGTYFTVQNMDVEYEYSFTNGELDVDKIIAKKKRREMLSVDVGKFNDFGRYSDDIPETKGMTIIFASDNIASNEYYADFNHADYGSARLVFSPDEKMLEKVTKALPRALRAKVLADNNNTNNN